MKRNLFSAALLSSLFLASLAFSEGEIKGLTIRYSRVLYPADRNGFEIPQAIIGGNVQHDGTAPVNVTLLIGGQSYTQPVDQLGNFSFLAYTAGASRYELQAWTVGPQGSDQSSTPSRVVLSQDLPGVKAGN